MLFLNNSLYCLTLKVTITKPICLNGALLEGAYNLALKIIWGVFNISWIILIFVSFEKKINPDFKIA